MKRIAVLISNKGTGTNLQAIIDGVGSGKINGTVAMVISDKEDAYGLQRAYRHNIPTEISFSQDELLSILKKYNIDYVALAGWRQFLTNKVMDAYKRRILNLHPGLIPDTTYGVVKNPDGTDGLWNKKMFTTKALQNFLDNSATYAGSSIHFLTSEVDFGPVVGRCFEKIQPGDTVESLYTRLKMKENKLYVDVLVKLCEPKNLHNKKTILITDAIGRGAALVDKYGQSKHVGKILVVPGNDLMQINTKKPVIIYQNLTTTSVPEIIEICKKEKIELVDIAQDNAIEVGLVDALVAAGISVVGPTRKAGQIEWDKAWARNFMVKYQIPAPMFYTFNSTQKGIEFVKKHPNQKWFVKAAGLAEGKGAIPASNINEAISAIKEMQRFGKSGETYLLEQWLIGEEFSAFALCDGRNFKLVGFAQDHKRVNDGDTGPNTGGMGCVSNPLIVDEDIKIQVEEIFKKTVDGLRKEDRPYKGVLYLGGMVDEGKVCVVEFNARWGDPEAEVIVPSIKNDLYEVSQDIASGDISNLDLKVDKKVRVVVAAAAKGYPVDHPKVKGKKVFGIDQATATGVKIYGAAIKKVNGDYVVNGGRVLFVMAEGKNVVEAREKVYKAMVKISIEGDNLHYRKDIGWRDVNRINQLSLRGA